MPLLSPWVLMQNDTHMRVTHNSALRYVQTLAPRRVLFMGDSAGRNLATTMCVLLLQRAFTLKNVMTQSRTACQKNGWRIDVEWSPFAQAQLRVANTAYGTGVFSFGLWYTATSPAKLPVHELLKRIKKFEVDYSNAITQRRVARAVLVAPHYICNSSVHSVPSQHMAACKKYHATTSQCAVLRTSRALLPAIVRVATKHRARVVDQVYDNTFCHLSHPWWDHVHYSRGVFSEIEAVMRAAEARNT